MISEERSSEGMEAREYEKFGLYPYKTLQDIVARLEAGEYKDFTGRALTENAAFQELEKMAYEPPIPDSSTATVAGIIQYLEEAGYTDPHNLHFRNHPLIPVLKLMNVRKLFRKQSEDGLRLLIILETSSFSAPTETGKKELKDDRAFHDLRKIIMLEGRGEN